METPTINIHKISEKEFFLSENLNLKITKKNIRLGFSFNFKWNMDSDIFEIITNIIYRFKNTKTEKDILKFKTAISFEVLDLKKYLTIFDDGNFDIPEDLMEFLISTVVSTNRGMLFYKTSGTYLSDFHLPILDINHLIASFKSDRKQIETKK